nr:hypothetical protein [Tanacetum cinerariifolium]
MEEISERYIAPCFVNGFEAYDGDVHLEFDENLILNEYAVQLCLDYEMKKGKKLVKKELIFAFKGEPYFVKFIINFEEDGFEPGDDSEKTRKNSDDWDQLLEFSFDDVPKFSEELPPFICKMGKTNRNKKRTIENLNLFYQDIGLSSSTEGHLTQKEAKKEALAVRISQKFVVKRIRLKRDNLSKTGQKREAWRSPEKSRAVSVDRARKTEENAKRMTSGTHDEEAGSSRSKRIRQHETVEEVLLPQVHYEFLL